MSTPTTHSSTSVSAGSLDPGKPKERTYKSAIGIVTGIIAAVLVYILMMGSTLSDSLIEDLNKDISKSANGGSTGLSIPDVTDVKGAIEAANPKSDDGGKYCVNKKTGKDLYVQEGDEYVQATVPADGKCSALADEEDAVFYEKSGKNFKELESAYIIDKTGKALTDSGLETTKRAMAIVAAVAVLMGIWWMTEAIPLAATALVPLIMFPLFGVAANVGAVGKSYGTGTIWLFMGGFFLALAMQRWNLQRRIALRIVMLVGTKPKQIVLGFMIATGFLSMWVSNTATAVMMLPIGISILALVGALGKEAKAAQDGQPPKTNFGTALMLGIAYSASIASLSTLIGTPPNATLKQNLAGTVNELNFASWMLFATPLAWVFLIITWWLLVNVFYKPEIDEIPGGKEIIKTELDKMGKMTAQEKIVLIIFACAALAWIILPTFTTIFKDDPNLKSVTAITGLFSDEMIAMILALVLFITPAKPLTGIKILNWRTAKDVPWDVLLLFGGGFALSDAFKSSGFSLWIGDKSKALIGIHPLIMIALFALLIIFLTEVTSNTATAATFIPIVIAVGTGMGLDPGALAVPVALAATCAFMLPVATPPNAIAFGSGYIRIIEMVKAGLWLNLIGVVLISLFTYFLAGPILGISFVPVE